MDSRSYEKDYDVQLDITIEMNLNQKILFREGYTVMDYISDIGGLQGILISGAAMLLSISNYNNLDNFLVTHLYLLHSSLTDTEPEVMKTSLISNPLDCLCSKLP